MYVVGIDFSIRYPGVCISKDFKEFTFFSIINNHNLSKINKSFLKDKINAKFTNTYIKFLNPPIKTDQYYISEQNKLVNYKNLIWHIITEIKKKVNNSKDIIISLEGIAYGAQGNALVDISLATGILRERLLNILLKNQIKKFFVFAPSELKNAINCKGNAPKNDIFKTFINNPIIEEVKNSDFYKFIVKNQNDKYIFNSKEEVKSPFSDMVDSYLAVLKVYNILNNK